MLRNDDRIAQPARGRFFPVSVAETVSLIRELGFATPTYRKRLDITFRNAAPSGDHGMNVATFYPADEMIVYSVPDDFDRSRARSLLEKALHEFARLAKDASPTDRRQIAVSLRAYFQAPGRLTITKRRRGATLAKYRGDAKPKGMKTHERVVHSLTVI
jgi:hypothetical protein